MKLNSYFKDFLTKISLSENQISRIKTTHETLRDRLNKDENLSKKITGTFLQGSYKRYTAIKNPITRSHKAPRNPKRLLERLFTHPFMLGTIFSYRKFMISS